MWGFTAALGSAIFFGLNATATKVLYDPATPSHIDPVGLITARSFWTLPLFLALALATRPSGFAPSRKDIAIFLLSGFCYGPATTGMYALAMGHTSAAHAVLFSSLAPPFATALAAIFLHERLQAIRLVAIGVGILGGGLLAVSHSSNGATPVGDAMIFVQVIMWAVMVLSVRILTRTYRPLFTAGVMGTLGSLILVVAGASAHRLDAALLPLRYFDIRTVLAFDLELVVLLSIAGQVCQSVALRILTITPTSTVISYGSIFFGLLGSFLIVNEHLGSTEILAGLLLVIALALALVPIPARDAIEPSRAPN
jgi:drug/metabolite transporter (DMT)-like permease